MAWLALLALVVSSLAAGSAVDNRVCQLCLATQCCKASWNEDCTLPDGGMTLRAFDDSNGISWLGVRQHSVDGRDVGSDDDRGPCAMAMLADQANCPSGPWWNTTAYIRASRNVPSSKLIVMEYDAVDDALDASAADRVMMDGFLIVCHESQGCCVVPGATGGKCLLIDESVVNVVMDAPQCADEPDGYLVEVHAKPGVADRHGPHAALYNRYSDEGGAACAIRRSGDLARRRRAEWYSSYELDVTFAVHCRTD